MASPVQQCIAGCSNALKNAPSNFQGVDRKKMTKEQFRKLRLKKGYTQRSFAELLNFNSGRYIRAIEKGDRPVTPRTQKLLHLLFPDETF